MKNSSYSEYHCNAEDDIVAHAQTGVPGLQKYRGADCCVDSAGYALTAG